jgi:leucyl-tRNA synthetase
VSTEPSDHEVPHRYTSALAAQIETRWQDRWDAEGTFEAPNALGVLPAPESAACTSG